MKRTPGHPGPTSNSLTMKHFARQAANPRKGPTNRRHAKSGMHPTSSPGKSQHYYYIVSEEGMMCKTVLGKEVTGRSTWLIDGD
jgi:hypothetical protein